MLDLSICISVIDNILVQNTILPLSSKGNIYSNKIKASPDNINIYSEFIFNCLSNNLSPGHIRHLNESILINIILYIYLLTISLSKIFIL